MRLECGLTTCKLQEIDAKSNTQGTNKTYETPKQETKLIKHTKRKPGIVPVDKYELNLQIHQSKLEGKGLLNKELLIYLNSFRPARTNCRRILENLATKAAWQATTKNALIGRSRMRVQ